MSISKLHLKIYHAFSSYFLQPTFSSEEFVIQFARRSMESATLLKNQHWNITKVTRLQAK